MRRGLLLAVVTALIASAPSPALAQETVQETPGEEEYCTVPADTAYQYDCEGPQTPECVPREQYAEDETSGCVAGPDQYGPCTASTPCDSEANDQIVQGDADSSGALPPASVQNVVVEVARSVTKDAPEASRALDTAQPKDSADNVALAAEVETVAEPPAEQSPADPPQTPEEPVAEPPAYAREAPQETTVESATTPPAAAVPYSTATPSDIAEAAEPPRIAEPVEVTEPAEATESAQEVDEQEEERGLEEADSEPVASYGLASVDQFMVPLFALGGGTLLVGGGLLVRRIVG